MEQKINEVGESHEKKMWASIFDLKTKFLKSPHPQSSALVYIQHSDINKPFAISTIFAVCFRDVPT